MFFAPVFLAVDNGVFLKLGVLAAVISNEVWFLEFVMYEVKVECFFQFYIVELAPLKSSCLIENLKF